MGCRFPSSHRAKMLRWLEGGIFFCCCCCLLLLLACAFVQVQGIQQAHTIAGLLHARPYYLYERLTEPLPSTDNKFRLCVEGRERGNTSRKTVSTNQRLRLCNNTRLGGVTLIFTGGAATLCTGGGPCYTIEAHRPLFFLRLFLNLVRSLKTSLCMSQKKTLLCFFWGGRK